MSAHGAAMSLFNYGIVMKVNNQPPIYLQIELSPVGYLKLRASELGLTHLQVVSEADAVDSGDIIDASADSIEQAQKHVQQAITELNEYFAGKRSEFDVTLAATGTVFQHEVWQALRELPFGQVCSYGYIANKINRPKAVRAVGAANGANPIAIIVPCHRVIGKNGTLTGYAYGLKMKQALLSLESAD